MCHPAEPSVALPSLSFLFSPQKGKLEATTLLSSNSFWINEWKKSPLAAEGEYLERIIDL